MSNMDNHPTGLIVNCVSPRIRTNGRRWHGVIISCTLGSLFIVAGCGGSGTGKSDKSLSGAISSTRAHYQIMDLATGQVSATGDVADIATNPIYRTSKLVFRRFLPRDVGNVESSRRTRSDKRCGTAIVVSYQRGLRRRHDRTLNVHDR